MKNPFKYEEVEIMILKLFIVVLTILAIAIFVKLGIEINNAYVQNRKIQELKYKSQNLTNEYNKIHKEVEAMVSEHI